MSGDFKQLRDRLRAFADARDWEKFHTPRNLALALAGEVGELVAELNGYLMATSLITCRTQMPGAD